MKIKSYSGALEGYVVQVKKNLTWLFISSIVIHQTVQFHNNKVQNIECVIYWWLFLQLNRSAVDVSVFLNLGVSLHQRIVVSWLCRILEGRYNKKAVLKCMTGLFEFVVPSFYVICEITIEVNSRNLQQTQNNNGGSSASTSPNYCLHAICCPQRQQNCTSISR